MRAAWLWAVLLLPSALAQASADPVLVTIDAPAGPVVPLGSPMTTTIHVEATCPAAAAIPPGASVTFSVTKQPSWASVTASPASDVFSVEQCSGTKIRLEGVLTFTASQDAPAFTPGEVSIVATIATAPNEAARGEGTVMVSAAYFSILDVQASHTQDTVEAGIPAKFPVKVTNFGNAPTLIRFALADANAGLDVALPEPFRLGSKQVGDNNISHDANVVATREAGAVGSLTFSVKLTSAYANDTSMAGDTTTLSFVVHPGARAEFRGEAQRALPAPAFAGAVLALAFAAASRRRGVP